MEIFDTDLPNLLNEEDLKNVQSVSRITKQPC